MTHEQEGGLYSFDPERFCKGRARMSRAVRNFPDETNFVRVEAALRERRIAADAATRTLKEAMDEIAKLRKEKQALRAELVALKDAARPLVKFAHALREVHKPYDQRACTMSGVMAYVTSDQLDALATLVGEEGK